MVTLQPPVQMGPHSWLIRFSSSLPGTPTFYIYIDGELVTKTTMTEYTMPVAPGTSYVVEVLDSADDEPLIIPTGKIRIGWFFVDDCKYYRIDEYIGDTWYTRKKMPDNKGYLTWESRFLEDGQNHTFRVVPVGTDGNEGTPKQFVVLMVRTPDVPDVSYTYNSTTNQITISEN